MTVPKRIQLRRTKGWRKPEGCIVVARPSRWGNPYKVAYYQDAYQDFDERELRAMAVSDFRGLLEGRWDHLGDDLPPYPPVDEIRAALAGHDLGCWCPLGQPCHADVLVELANGPETA